MPSPLAHGSIVLLAYAWTTRRGALAEAIRNRPRVFVAATLALLWVPDIDFALSWLVDHPLMSHGGASHSLAAGLGFGALYTGACRWMLGPALPLAPMLAVGICVAWSHPLMDLVTQGDNGIMILWPITTERYLALPFFFGLNWSQPLAWNLHLITLVTETFFVLAVAWVADRTRKTS